MKTEITQLIESDDLKEITLELVEKTLDNEITDETLKEIPILKYLVAAKNIYNSYTDRIFIKKTMKVLLEIGVINWKERVDLTESLKDNESSGTEKILLAIDGMQTMQKCKVYGKLCRLRALKKISVDEFLRLTKLIQDSYLEDLLLVPYFTEKKKDEVFEEEFFPLISLGLIYQEQSEPSPIEKVEPYELGEHEYYKGGEINFTYSLSYLGDTLLKCFDELFPKEN
tara:strand:- start:155 stop:835 length:681 start_codon:yes stop_codon:yes gene_type:complete